MEGTEGRYRRRVLKCVPTLKSLDDKDVTEGLGDEDESCEDPPPQRDEMFFGGCSYAITTSVSWDVRGGSESKLVDEAVRVQAQTLPKKNNNKARPATACEVRGRGGEGGTGTRRAW